jgi:N-acetylglucosaminyldiphosphoundecaprenol N-acetyl-beta-D-mannosaminyltransferase
MNTAPFPRHDVLGVGISQASPGDTAGAVIASARSGTPLAVSALAVHAVMEAHSHGDYRARLNALDIAAPDGQPVRWALNVLHGVGLTERVYGPFLMRDVCARAALENLPIFLFGSDEAILGKLSATLCTLHPGLKIAGTRASRFRRISREEALGDAAAIAASGAKIVFCGLGCPRQEAWVHAMKPLVSLPLIGVGAAFALWAGERTMAPAWMQDNGLEWLYRLGQEPTRLAGRYLVQGPGFFAAVAAQRLGLRTAGTAPQPVEPEYWG